MGAGPTEDAEPSSATIGFHSLKETWLPGWVYKPPALRNQGKGYCEDAEFCLLGTHGEPGGKLTRVSSQDTHGARGMLSFLT